MNDMHAPVALFAYQRVDHLRQTVESLLSNEACRHTHLYVFCDGPASEDDVAAVAAVREYVEQIEWPGVITRTYRDQNIGLAASIIAGAGEVVARHGAVIVLEDDLLVSPHFLRFMNDALERYADDESVGCISAYMYPVQVPAGMPDTLLLPFPMSWGWATWGRAWRLFERDGRKLVEQLNARGMAGRFDRVGPGKFMRMLNDQVAGFNNSWFIRWHASLFLAGKLSLAPTRSMIRNIGLDGSGVHCSSWRFDPYRVQPSPVPLSVGDAAHAPVPAFERALRSFFIKSRLLRYVNALDRLVFRAPLRAENRTGERNGER